jgi:hypothetical protein
MADIRALAGRFGHYPDPESSTDPVISALIGQLRALPAGPALRADFRSELHAQLVAVTPRLVAEGVASPDVAAKHRTPVQRGWGRLRTAASRMPMRRPLAVVASLVVVFGLLLSGAVWLSSHTLPGDSLYGLKRASENVQLSLISGDGARGREYLALAKRRVNEATSLLSKASASAAGVGPQAAGGVNPHTASLVAATLSAADADLRNGSRLLTGQAVHNTSDGPLKTLSSWSPHQIARLRVVADRVPSGSLHHRVLASEQLAQRVLDRAHRLAVDLGCNCLRSTSSDDLGPLPCQGVCNPVQPATPGPGTTPSPAPRPSVAPSSSGGTVTRPSTSAPTLPPNGTVSTPHGQPRSTAPTDSRGTTRPTTTAPGRSGLPLPNSASVPITVDTCGLQVTLGPLGLGVGTCGLNLTL